MLLAQLLLGVAVADVASHCLHWLQHQRGWPCRLHQRRHHATYAGEFYTKATDDRMPSFGNLDESATLFLLPWGLVPMGLPTTTCLASALALLVAFYLHTAAHSRDMWCPVWYRARHEMHHQHPNTHFSLLTPIMDCVMQCN